MAFDLEYLEEAVAEAAAGFEAELDEAEAAIRRLPHAWPTYDHGTRRYLLRRYPFGIVYEIEADRILIVAVAHGRRRPGYWRGRL